MLTSVNEQSFENEVVNNDHPVVVDFWAAWCGPCRSLAPVIEQVAEEYAGKVKFVKVDVDENPGLANKFGIKGIPTLLFFKKGEVVEQEVGFVTRESLVEKVDSILSAQ